MSFSRKRRGSNARSRVRKAAQKAGFRSAFEQRVAEGLSEYEYEPFVIAYEVHETKKYTPDFALPNKVILECKGRLTADDRKKMLLVKEQHPELDIRFVFMYPNNKLTARSKTRYWEWAEKHGFKWADNTVPKEWYEKE